MLGDVRIRGALVRAEPRQLQRGSLSGVVAGGTLLFTVVVRDIAFNPVASSTVVLDFSRCPGATFCPSTCTGCTVDSPTRSVRKLTNAAGVATFDLRMGGGCPTNSVWIFADGVLLGQRALASIDQDGDLSVTAADLALLTTKLGSPDPTADFDCSGLVDSADQALLQNHLGSTCDTVVPVRPHTWGGLKIRYR